MEKFRRPLNNFQFVDIDLEELLNTADNAVSGYIVEVELSH